MYSWRKIQVANAYLSSSSYKREMDSHMMKNTEWGAVAYLQHSRYGSQTSVRVNNRSDYRTGYASFNELTIGFTGTNISCNENPTACNEYGTSDNITKSWNTEIGVKASTTGNISGIYDMSGGAWEYVMGVMLDSKNEKPCSGKDINNSGFNGTYCSGTNEKTDGVDFPESKYYDLYSYSMIDEDYQRRILGDATGEMGPFSNTKYQNQTRQIGSWYDDEAWFVHFGWPWFFRGGLFTMGKSSGVFGFLPHEGHANSDVGFRIVLAF